MRRLRRFSHRPYHRSVALEL